MPRAFHCRCGRPVFFRNSECLPCQTPMGYFLDMGQLLPLQNVGDERWRAWGSGEGVPRFQRCAHLHSAASCNWLVTGQTGPASAQPLRRGCAVTRTGASTAASPASPPENCVAEVAN